LVIKIVEIPSTNRAVNETTLIIVVLLFIKELDLVDVNYSDVVVMVKSSAGDQLLLDVKAVSGNDKKCRIYTNDQNLTNAVAHILV
jgi:hypothetical protein